MAVPFEVVPYDIGTLRRLMAEKARASQAVIDCKTHSEYFESYFKHLDAKTIVVENDYIDRDFLEDFAAYYVRCFHDYERKCTRLHFFSHAFSEAEFAGLLNGDANGLRVQQLQGSYLGFVVVKPLPRTVVGRTCLRTYNDNIERSYPITRKYDASLFGIELTVETLAFQEQDSVVAACATSALWSAFQGTGILFQHAIPSPVEITKAASVHFSSSSRNLPNTGLTAEQMAHAIRSVGLEPLALRAQDPFVFRNTLYAYLRGHVPILLLVTLIDTSQNPPKIMGKHAVAAAGYRLLPQHGKTTGLGGYISAACHIDRVYAHDDGVGPFARMVFDVNPLTITANGQTLSLMALTTSWPNAAGVSGTVRAVPDILLVPLYHKIRIPFSLVQDAVIQFDLFVESLRQQNIIPLSERLLWDVFLTTVGDLKKDILVTPGLDPALRLRTLSGSLPRFIWRATARCAADRVVDLLFDATDIEQGHYFVEAVKYNSQAAAILQAVANHPDASSLIGAAGWTILESFAAP